MGKRVIFRIIPLVVCGIGAVSADIEHFTSLTFGTAWNYGLQMLGKKDLHFWVWDELAIDKPY